MAGITAKKVLMVNPQSFRRNEQTVGTNSFQGSLKLEPQEILQAAQRESRRLQTALRERGIEVLAMDEPLSSDTPDALFPNNWFVQLPNSALYLFPMFAENRRREVQPEWLKSHAPAATLHDLRRFESQKLFLEGTGSLILDHQSKLGYACLSPRTQTPVIAEFSRLSGYSIFTFSANDPSGGAYYHTNVMLALGVKSAVVCVEGMSKEGEKELLLKKLKDSGKEVVQISHAQVSQFCGNLLQLTNANGQLFWVCSTRAYDAFTKEQRRVLEMDSEIIHVPLPVIETIGGGGARCMLAELF